MHAARSFLAAGAILIAVSGCPKKKQPTPVDGDPDPAAEVNAVDAILDVDQGWDGDARDTFWRMTQGSQLLPYGWYMVLEDVDSAPTSAVQRDADGLPFHRDGLYQSWRFLPEEKGPGNPDGLPVGWTTDDGYRRAFDDWGGSSATKTRQRFVGLTCAACHTAQINVQDGDRTVGVRIQGAGTQGDLEGWLRHLDTVLAATFSDPDRWQRFEAALKERYPQDWSEDLRQRFAGWMAVRKGFTERTSSTQHGAIDGAYGGFSRVDAFDGIINQIVTHALRVPENQGPMDAPVSFPYTWDTPYYSWVEVGGQASNAGIGPLGRNVGEALGTFSFYDLVVPVLDADGKPTRDADGAIVYERAPGASFDSTVNLPNLVKIEQALAEMRSPRWRDTPLPPVDTRKALRGAEVYTESCARCHISVDRDRIDEQALGHPAKLLPTFAVLEEDLGTDPNYLRNMNRIARTGSWEGTKKRAFDGATFESAAPVMDLFIKAVEGVTASTPVMDLGLIGGAVIEGRGNLDKPPPRFLVTPQDGVAPLEWPQTDYAGYGSYKARGLNGVWATAPYLHNGSVPTLWDLLQAPEDRPATFQIGDFTYDPVKVGYVTESDQPDVFTVDTTRVSPDGGRYGNSNAGHLWGTDLSDEDKWALIEYLKSI